MKPSAPSHTLSYPEYRATKYFGALDGLRALSALLVISVHMGANIQHHFWSWLRGMAASQSSLS